MPCCAAQKSRAGIPTRARRRTTSVAPTRFTIKNVALGGVFEWDLEREVILLYLYLYKFYVEEIHTDRQIVLRWRTHSASVVGRCPNNQLSWNGSFDPTSVSWAQLPQLLSQN